MNFATASFYLTAVITSSFATIGETRLLSKAGKAEGCQDALNGFNLGYQGNPDEDNQDYFGSHNNGYIRTICAGNTFLLTNPENAHKIYESMCPNDDGFKKLDGYVQTAEEAGGCTGRPWAGQPSRAMEEYIKCRDDAKVAADMVCTDAGDDNLCWSVLYQLQKEVCWTSNSTEPALDNDECLPLSNVVETTVEGKDVQVNVSCECLEAYVTAYGQFTKNGLASIGADENTLALVENRLQSSTCVRAAGKEV